jgi:hypothetical protein
MLPLLAPLARSLSLFPSEPAFVRLSLAPGAPRRINLSRRVALFIDAPPFNYTVLPGAGPRPRACPDLRLAGGALALSVAAPAVLPLWLLPDGFCGAATAVLSTAHLLRLTARAAARPGVVCLFSQTQFGTADAALTFRSKDRRAVLAFHRGDGGEPEKCHVSEKCHFHAHRPFLLRIFGDGAIPADAKLEYKIREPAPGAECAVRGVAWRRETAPENFAQLFPEARWRCRSKADILPVLGFVGIAVLAAVFATACWNRWNPLRAGSRMPGDFDKQRFEALKKAPFAVPLGRSRRELSSDDE